jgi:hypothetical protein
MSGVDPAEEAAMTPPRRIHLVIPLAFGFALVLALDAGRRP